MVERLVRSLSARVITVQFPPGFFEYSGSEPILPQSVGPILRSSPASLGR